LKYDIQRGILKPSGWVLSSLKEIAEVMGMTSHLRYRLLVLVLLLMVLSGCGNNRSEAVQEAVQPSPPANTKTTLHFAFCVSHQQNDFIIGITRDVEAAARDAGVDMTVLDANQNAEKQVGQVEGLVTQGIDGILIEPVSKERLAPAIRYCKESKIPVVTFNQKVSNQDQAISFVGVDMVQGGALEMEEAAKVLKGKGNIVLLHGPMGSDAQVGRQQGYKEVLAKYPEIRIVAQQSANWVRSDAFTIMENWLQSGLVINAVVSQNDDMALGALKAVEQGKIFGEIPVFGIDATPDGLKAIRDGHLTCTVSQNADQQAKTAVQALVDAATGKAVKGEYIIDHVLIDRSNINQYLK